MRPRILILLSFALTLTASAQVPQAFEFQGIARDDDGNVLASQEVELRVGVLAGSAIGPVIFQEIHVLNTSPFGLIRLQVGNGLPVLGTFSSVPWVDGEFHLQVEMNTGNGLVDMGATQLLSVPYALVAATTTECMSVSLLGDTLFQGNGCYVIIPGISAANGGCADMDGDGYYDIPGCGTDVDCNDMDTAINPGMNEICDDIDNDCDGQTDGVEVCGTCSDEILNGQETGIDCGGPQCPPCGQGGSCMSHGDCGEGLVCEGGICVPDCPDIDGDGWTVCDGDCDDQDPLVNPGALEIAGNGRDDDCNGMIDESSDPCSAVVQFNGVTAMDMAAAMGLCKTTVEEAPLSERSWGLVSAAQIQTNGTQPDGTTLLNMQDHRMAVLSAYGSGGVLPAEGSTMAGMSTGRMRSTSDPGFSAPAPGTTFGDPAYLPENFMAAYGGLPLTGGCGGSCPVGNSYHDPASLRLRIRVPTNVNALRYQYRFFSSEYASWTCSSFNDRHFAILKTDAPGLPWPGNIGYDTYGNLISVNSQSIEICTPMSCYTCPSGPSQLMGTGMEMGNTGGGTEWITVTAPVIPGEIVELDLMIFDVGDGAYDSVILLDGLEWLPITP